MKINRISWQNYRGISDGEIVADTHDVLITGRNGSGKSTIASVLPFVLFGADANKSKRYEDGLLPTDDGLVHAAEVEFDDGLTLRREYFWARQGNRQKLFVDGSEVKAKEFDAQVALLTNGAGQLMFSPFAFCNMHPNDQRALLMKLFCRGVETIDEKISQILRGRSPDKFISDAKRDLNRLTKDATGIAPAIDELERQLADAPPNIDAKLADIEQNLTDLSLLRKKILDEEPSDTQKHLHDELIAARAKRDDILTAQAADNPARDLADVESHLAYHQDLDRELAFNNAEYQKRLAELREDYRLVKTSEPGKCPTCGQDMPLDKFVAIRDAKLAALSADGQKVAELLSQSESALATNKDILTDLTKRKAELTARVQQQDANPDTRLADVNAQINEISTHLDRVKAEERDRRNDKLAKISREVTDLTQLQTRLTDFGKLRQRIQALRDEERNLNEQIATLDYQIATVKDFLFARIKRVESNVNGHFHHVNFKLFDVLITTGEIKPTCEPMLDGVPYSSLSKGERLKAALDIFHTLQEVYNVQLPLFIDDAEAYTANSFLGMPNQKFTFSVAESDLTIAVQQGEATHE